MLQAIITAYGQSHPIIIQCRHIKLVYEDFQFIPNKFNIFVVICECVLTTGEKNKEYALTTSNGPNYVIFCGCFRFPCVSSLENLNFHVWVIYFLFYFAVISTHFTFQLISFACLMLPAFLLFLQIRVLILSQMTPLLLPHFGSCVSPLGELAVVNLVPGSAHTLSGPEPH